MTTPVFEQTITGYSLRTAHGLAQASELAYHDEEKITTTAAVWGMPECRFFREEFEQPFPLDDTQAYVAGNAKVVVVAFRGTEPSRLRDWLADAEGLLAPDPNGKGMVHMGFNNALDAVYPQVLNAVSEMRGNGQSICITGHSLGGALAMLAAARMRFGDSRLLADGVYTFGQPRTCDPLMARAFDREFKGRMFRFVNNSDIVPQLPPEPVYHHVDEEKYFDADGRLREKKMSLLGGLTEKAQGQTVDPMALGTDAIGDHGINRYIANLEKAMG
ncbi:hypothetical protein GCM10009799_22360 [Nocardiopsis rhodophaea]|uniref:Fungal lipase-type domain-containing protein n=1 Tax=Nocardiopsis rhodophaea TaxID=280238 RepID=A0ABP5ECU6_9ACTN